MLQSTRSVLVSPGSRAIYATRYPNMPENHWAVIPNGYAEESFAEVERTVTRPSPNGHPLHLLHSGLLYPTPDRDPSAFFAALSQLRANGQIAPGRVRVTLRASGFDEHYRAQIHRQGLEDLIQLAPPIPYREALAEMLTADGLLVFQGYTSNPAVPAKLYEYLRAQRPIFALADKDGDTAATLRSVGAGTIVPLDSSEQIAQGLTQFLDSIRQGTAPVANEQIVRSFARESRATELAALLDEVVREKEISTGGVS